MSTSAVFQTGPNGHETRVNDEVSVLRALEQFCLTNGAGSVMPSHTEWMQQLGATERTVRWALDELQRRGRIVRRRGAKTLVTDVAASKAAREETLVPRSLVDARTVVAIAKPDRAIFDRAMSLLCRHAEAAGLALSCRLLHSNACSEPNEDVGEKPLGYLLFHKDLAPLARKLRASGNRVVLIGAPLVGQYFEVPNVYGDQGSGGYLAARHLLDLGHKRIAFQGDVEMLETRRWKGFARACDEARQNGQEVTVTTLSFAEVASWRGRLDLVRAFFHSPEAPTAVAVWNDHEAVALLGQMMRSGVRVPEEVSIIGYDDLPEGRLIHPALTTVDTAIERQLLTALELLTSSIAPPANHSVVVLPTLICRDSSAPPSPNLN